MAKKKSDTATAVVKKVEGGFNPNKAADALAAEMNKLISKKVGDVDTRSLGDLDFVPYYLSTGNLALNWAISGKMLDGGVPASKIFMIYGDPGCLHGDMEVEVMIDEKLLDFLDT